MPVIGMKVADYREDGSGKVFVLLEKGNKPHKVPAHHKAQEYLHEYLTLSGLMNSAKPKEEFLFQATDATSRNLSGRQYTRVQAFRMVQRRARQAGLTVDICNHTFRATGITAYLSNGGSLEQAQNIAKHASATTTRLYDRRSKKIEQQELERIRL